MSKIPSLLEPVCEQAIANEAHRERVEALAERFVADGEAYQSETSTAVLSELEAYATHLFSTVETQIAAAAGTKAGTVEELRAKATLLGALADGVHFYDDLARSVSIDVCRFTPAPEVRRETEQRAAHAPASSEVTLH